MSSISYSEWKKRNEALRFRYNIEDHKHGNVFPIVSQVATGGVIINVGFAT